MLSKSLQLCVVLVWRSNYEYYSPLGCYIIIIVVLVLQWCEVFQVESQEDCSWGCSSP